MERTTSAKEAILLASAPKDVRDYLEKRASERNFFDPIGDEAEAELLGKGDRLIDLSLAEFCLYPATARALFDRDSDDWPIRSLVLSNRALSLASFIAGFPECLFGSNEETLEYLKAITPDERATLFSNPTLDDRFLESFLSLGEPWEAMDPEQRLWALVNLASNEKLRSRPSAADHDDGYGWYLAGKPFEAAWSLIEKLEVTTEVAARLGRLLYNLPAEAHTGKSLLEAVCRWKTPDEILAKEEEDNAKGLLSDFQTVRQAGARLLANRHDADRSQFLDSDDIALRCGAYQGNRWLDTEATRTAVERDGDLARVHLIRNAEMWRREKTRDLLRSEILSGAKADEPRWEYRSQEHRYREEFPSWFGDEDDFYQEPDDRPLTESSISDLVSGVASDPAVRSLHERLTALETATRTHFWMLVMALIILASLAWR